jgi:UDP-N-acetylglucosamine diphosphorylase / glucose-1-phosphate thymidylyltransferase / UDP-N-acetylgalactosamine diphosphorylase / glucosamine-1-phosphate N-acetyltransferase / galactosamine-1-phosphate N-acetyltransferase
VRLVLFRSAALPSGAWSPFRETRAPGDLLFGTRTLRDRIEAETGLRTEVTPGPDPTAPTLLLDPRFVPEAGVDIHDLGRRMGESADRPLRLEADPGIPGDPMDAGAPPATVGWVLPAGWPPSPPPEADPGAGTFLRVRLEGRLLPTPWHLMAANGDRVARDLAASPPGAGRPLDLLPPGVSRVGDHPVTVEDAVTLDPFVLLDTRSGPIHLARGVEVRGQTRHRGTRLDRPRDPAPRGRLLGLSAGPVCRLRGEIEASVIGAWCNKAHDGYLGHAVVGRWVNLGAFTTNSDLKNTYGTVRVHQDPGTRGGHGDAQGGGPPGRPREDGDRHPPEHRNRGGRRLEPLRGGAPPALGPPLFLGRGRSLVPYRLDAFLEVAERAMARRGPSGWAPCRGGARTSPSTWRSHVGGRMKLAMLGSGSRGNATYVEVEGTRVLVDAGFSGPGLERLARIGVDPGSLDALIVTHEHGDHTRGVGILARKFDLPVYLTAGTRAVCASLFRGRETLVETRAGPPLPGGVPAGRPLPHRA